MSGVSRLSVNTIVIAIQTSHLGLLAASEIFPNLERTVSPNRNFNFVTTRRNSNEDLPGWKSRGHGTEI